MQKQDVAGLKINFTTKKELLEVLTKRISQGQKTWVTTPYSEFLYAGLKNPGTLEMLNQADVAVPDGIGIFWAKKFLEIPFTFRNYWLKIFQAFWQAKYSLLAILFNPKWLYNNPSQPPLMQRGGDIANAISPSFSKEGAGGVKFFEKIPGSELVWDIAKLASENNWSIYLLGGFDNTAELAAQELKIKNLKLKIAGTSSRNPSDATITDDIKKVQPDVLLVAYGPLQQEAWIAQNLSNLPIKLVIGVGGTFDYLAKKRLNPPKFIRKIGLEWLFRLFTQPHRIKRIYQATFGLVNKLIHYKVFESLPLRQNVVTVILNSDNKVLVCKRNPKRFENKLFGLTFNDMGTHWQFPQGGMDEKESYVDTGLRECKEEVNLTKIEYISTSKNTYTYNFFNARRPFFGQSTLNKGQKQYILYFRHLGKDTDAQIDNQEFENYRWVEIPELKNILHKYKKPLAEIAMADLKDMHEKAIIS
jgi:exopolysaccharide biosynthesis WecB/TagA/CpsF family protein